MRADESKAGTRAKQPSSARGRHRARSVPLLRLLIYYALLVGTGLLVMRFVPGAALAINAPIAQTADPVTDLVTGASSAISTGSVGAAPWGGPMGRLGLAVFAALGALLLALPVAWVQMFTRRLRYDPSLVQAIIILPIVVAGVVLVVKNSLALAFALAGIVAGVRFRQKLSEPQDAVYVLLALGIGLAAGVQALDVALAVSLIFNIVVLGLWRYDLGAIYAPGTAPMLATGDTSVIVARTAADRHALRDEIADQAAGMDLDGILIVHTWDADAARHSVDLSLSGVAKEWRYFAAEPAPNGMSRLDVAVRLKGSEDPVELLGELEERWSAQIVAAEYIPHRIRRPDENGTEKKKDDDE